MTQSVDGRRRENHKKKTLKYNKEFLYLFESEKVSHNSSNLKTLIFFLIFDTTGHNENLRRVVKMGIKAVFYLARTEITLK